MQKEFVSKAVEVLENDEKVVGLAVAGSWITAEIDAYSDVDLILFTKETVGNNNEKMKAYANKFGTLLSAFTGEHVGEPRVLICLYDDPLLHVDIKFLTLDEYTTRIENPVVVFERENVITNLMKQSEASWPYPDYQWIEDRFWTWVHYAALKLGRGEDFEALDFLSFIRSTVLAPLLQIKNGNLPRGLRKVESKLSPEDLAALKTTITDHEPASLFTALESSVELYQSLRKALFDDRITQHNQVECKVLHYLHEIKAQRLSIKNPAVS